MPAIRGAPLGGSDEFEDPRYDLDPQGKRIPLDAHIRLANPRTADTADQRILRRGFNYTRGFDSAGALDQGLIFSAFNQSPDPSVRDDSGTAGERADDRLHHSRRRRLLLRPAGGARRGRLGGVGAVRGRLSDRGRCERLGSHSPRGRVAEGSGPTAAAGLRKGFESTTAATGQGAAAHIFVKARATRKKGLPGAVALLIHQLETSPRGRRRRTA